MQTTYYACVMATAELSETAILTHGCLQADDMCSLPAMGYDFDPPHLHTVVMTDLVCHSPDLALCPSWQYIWVLKDCNR